MCTFTQKSVQAFSLGNALDKVQLSSPIQLGEYRSNMKQKRRGVIVQSTSSSSESLAKQLKQTIVESKMVDSVSAEDSTKEDIENLTSQLEDEFSSSRNLEPSANSRFDPLIGLYEVSHVQTTRDGDNPVGGKWTRKNKFTSNLFKLRRTFQHVLPLNSTGLVQQSTDDKFERVAECINVVSLEFLKLLRVMVVLRGDAISLSPEQRRSKDMVKPLSDLAVKVLFDPPYIGIGPRKGIWCSLQLGPKTDVILDTTHVDNLLRVGMGGVSGSKFVFCRCEDKDEEANEFKALLKMRPVRRRMLLGTLGTLLSVGWLSFSRGYRIFGGLMSVLASLLGFAVGTSTGGVEADRQMSS
jgi:hypothetical protein